MNLQQLEYFLACTENGSLTKAAEVLYTTQPHVSQVIHSLENELNLRLFTRNSFGIALTREGEQIYYYAQNIFKNAEMIRTISSEVSERNLRIAANPSSSLAFLLGDFLKPQLIEGITLQYTECGIEQMMELLQNRQYDLGLLFVPSNKISVFSRMTERHHLLFTPLRRADLVLHSGPQSHFYQAPLLKPEALNGCSLIQLEDDFFSVEDLLMENPGYKAGKHALKKIIRTNSDHLMIRMLQQTSLCNIGSYWSQNIYEEHHFSMSVIDGFQNQISFGYLHIDNRPLRPDASAFLELLQEKIQDDIHS